MSVPSEIERQRAGHVLDLPLWKESLSSFDLRIVAEPSAEPACGRPWDWQDFGARRA